MPSVHAQRGKVIGPVIVVVVVVRIKIAGSIINARRACAQGIIIVNTLCVCVCLEFAAFISCLYTKYDNIIPVYFSQFEKKPSLRRRSAFMVINVCIFKSK